MEVKKVFVGIVVILLLAGGGFLFYKVLVAKPKPTPSEKNPDKPSNGKLSEKELEKYLLEKRLELKKYFVFNLGELKVEPSETTQFANRRGVKSGLSRDLTKLAAHCEEKMKEKNYKMDSKYVRIPKEYISFMGGDFTNYDKEEWWGVKIDEKINNWKDKFIIFEKDDELEKVCFGMNVYDDKPGEIFWVYNNTIYLRMKVPTTKICESKEKALEIIKTDPALQGRV